MKSPKIKSSSIDIKAFFDGLSWDNEVEVQRNLGALTSGITLLQEAILNNLALPEGVDYPQLTRALQDSDPLYKLFWIVEGISSTLTGESSRFEDVAANLGLLREILVGLIEYASDEAGAEARENALKVYLDLLPKIHAEFVISEDALLRWKAVVMLEQQVDFVAGSLMRTRI